MAGRCGWSLRRRLWITGQLEAAAADFAESDLSLDAVDFSEEPDVPSELDASEPEDELVLAEPLVELFADSRLSVR